MQFNLMISYKPFNSMILKTRLKISLNELKKKK